MKRLTDYLHTELACRRQFFKTAARENAAKNLSMLQALCVLSFAMLLLHILVNPLLLNNWQPNPLHFWMLPVFALCFLVLTLLKSRIKSPTLVSLLCLVFQAGLLAFILLVDARLDPDAPASFMPVLFVALPVLFILPGSLEYTLLLITEALYVYFCLGSKAPFLARYDIFNSVVAIIFSLVVYQLVMHLRTKDHDLRVQYMRQGMEDSLSGILNKKTSEEAVILYLEQCGSDCEYGLILLDLDDFKLINDQNGHYVGDMMLKALGQTLRETFRATDVVGRFGGDEFLILIKGAVNPALLELKCQTIQHHLLDALTEKQLPPASCSMGAIQVSGVQTDFVALVKEADSALYEAKAAGKGTCVVRRMAKI